MAYPQILKGREGLFLFLAPFLLALSLRLSLVREGLPFWYDEIWAANFAAFSVSWDKGLDRLLREDSHPPLAYLLYRLWAEAWELKDPLVARSPAVEEGLRTLSALLGAGTAGLTGLLARSLGPPPLLALGAGVLYALAPAALAREAEVHIYPAAAFFTVLALLFWAVRRPWAFALAALLAFHTHYLTLPLLLLPALSLGRKGFLPYALALPWTLYAVPRQAAGLAAKSPFNGLPQDAIPQMASFSHIPEPALVGVGALLWLLALLSALVPRARPVGLTLLLYLFLWLVLLPGLTGFNAYSVRYTTLVLPLVLAGAVLFLSGLRVRAEVLLLLPLVGFGLALPVVRVSYLDFRYPNLMALVLEKDPAFVAASGKPLAVSAKYACRSCPVEVYGEESMERLLREGGYLFADRTSLQTFAGEEPRLPSLLRKRAGWVAEQGGVYLIRLHSPGLTGKEGSPGGGIKKPPLPHP